MKITQDDFKIIILKDTEYILQNIKYNKRMKIKKIKHVRKTKKILK
jgi:hypothetical protein